MVIFKDFCNAEKTNKNKHNVEIILTTFLRGDYGNKVIIIIVTLAGF